MTRLLSMAWDTCLLLKSRLSLQLVRWCSFGHLNISSFPYLILVYLENRLAFLLPWNILLTSLVQVVTWYYTGICNNSDVSIFYCCVVVCSWLVCQIWAVWFFSIISFLVFLQGLCILVWIFVRGYAVYLSSGGTNPFLLRHLVFLWRKDYSTTIVPCLGFFTSEQMVSGMHSWCIKQMIIINT